MNRHIITQYRVRSSPVCATRWYIGTDEDVVSVSLELLDNYNSGAGEMRLAVSTVCCITTFDHCQTTVNSSPSSTPAARAFRSFCCSRCTSDFSLIFAYDAHVLEKLSLTPSVGGLKYSCKCSSIPGRAPLGSALLIYAKFGSFQGMVSSVSQSCLPPNWRHFHSASTVKCQLSSA